MTKIVINSESREVFITTDGLEFLSEELAYIHEVTYRLHKWADANLTAHPDRSEIVDALQESWKELLPILTLLEDIS